MPAYDESFAPEPEEAAPVVADAPESPQEVADSTATDTPEGAENTETSAESAESTAESTEQTEESTEQGTAEEGAAKGESTTTESAPAFVEADYLKSVLGDAAPTTAAELKTRFEELQAKQITPEQQAQLALLADPAKLAEYSQLATQDFDKLPAVDVFRAKFALDHPNMPAEILEDEFLEMFTQKYPTLAAALNDRESVDENDPLLAKEMKKADYYALADRTALKTAQEERTKQFVASHAPAATQPKLSAEQQADMTALPKWLDEAYKDGATIPVDAGDGLKFTLPVPNAADFKAAFNDTYSLLDKFTLTKPLAEGGVINRENHALVTAFLQNPAAFVQNVAKAARAAMPKPAPGIPIASLTNSSSSNRPAPKPATAAAAPVTGESNQPPGIDADSWHNSTI